MKKAIKIILILVFLLYAFRLMGSMFLFSPFSIFDGKYSDEKLDELIRYNPDKYAGPRKDADIAIPQAKISYNPVNQKIIDYRLNCATNVSIPAKYRKEKMLCQNIYATSAEELKALAEKEKPARIVLYGQNVIYNCPAFSQKNITDLIEGCFLSGRFLDNVQLPKMAQILGFQLPKEYLYVHFDENGDEITRFCNLKDKTEEAAACFNNRKEIHLPLGNSFDDKFYPQGAPVYNGGTKGRSDERVAYSFNLVFPRGCYTTIHASHEVMHYLDYVNHGKAPAWFKESMVTLISNRMTDAICSPGYEFKNVVKIEDGRVEPVKDFNHNSEEYRLFELYKYWKDDACHKAFIITVNDLLNAQGMPYLPRLYSALAQKSAASQGQEISTKDLTRAVVESSGNNPEVKKFMVNQSKCPY